MYPVEFETGDNTELYLQTQDYVFIFVASYRHMLLN